MLGELTPAREHFEQGVALYDPLQHRSLAFLYGQDPKVASLSPAAIVLWHLGYPDQALKSIHWFTEGFDTVDLKEAKALLEELA